MIWSSQFTSNIQRANGRVNVCSRLPERLCMKNLRILTFILFLSPITAFAKDALIPSSSENLSVFDLTLNEPFNIRECHYEIVEQPMGIEGIAIPKRSRGLFGEPDHITQRYRYTEAKPSTDKCFQKVGPFYTSSPEPGASLPPAPPNNQKVKLVYADSLRPAIADSEDIWVGIQDSKLTGIRFYFQNRKEQDVLQILSNKYGRPSSTEEFALQTPAGDRKDYYRAKWLFPRLQVTFLSLDTNQIGYDPQNAPLGYYSEVGSVTVQHTVQEKSQVDNNPL